ncbi:MAG: SDR family oxidoreductase [Rhodospirillaceae bacterium]|nr:SDR family oxidoreductase [Rhodospirillaceae bacterium]MDD9926675.1 SDR family oxidoreductase [Rhodospirillaceae bacterium]
MRVLIFGATGLLGPYIVEAAAGLGEVVSCGHRGGAVRCDATDSAAVAAVIGKVDPQLVVNCVALTDVDGCETDTARADGLNRKAVASIVSALPEDARLVQVSTDQVYAGDAAPYAEDDIGPINEYGRSKLAGEVEAMRFPGALVLRLNFFGPSRTPGRSSLSDWMIETLAAGAPMTLFEDSLFSPLHLETAARVTVDAARRGLTGIYNLGSRDGASKADFGLAIAQHLSLDAGQARIGQSADTPGRARRPKDMRMDVSRIEAALGYPMPTLRSEIQRLSISQ